MGRSYFYGNNKFRIHSNSYHGTVTSSTGTNATIPLGNGTNAGLLSPGKYNEIVANTLKNTNVSTNLSEGTVTTTTVDVNSSDGTNATLLAASGSRAGVLTTARYNNIIANNAKNTNVTTNITVVEAPTNVDIQSSDGSNDTIAAANGTNAGVMTTTMYDEHVLNNAKNTNVTTNLSTTYTSTTFTIVSSDGSNALVAHAVASGNGGAMSGADKAKLDGIEAGADVNVDTNIGYTASTRVLTSSTGTGFTFPVVVASGNSGLMTGSDKAKLNGIEALADVTDSTNVNAAGATMNSDTTMAGNSYFLDEDTLSSNSATKVASQQSIKTYVDNLLAANDAMVFKGTVGSGGTYEIAAFNSLVVYDVGWTYRVITAGTIKGVVAEIGDMYVSTVDRTGGGGVNADWTVLQTNIDGAVIGPSSAVDNRIATFDGTSGKLIKDSGLLVSSFVQSVGGTSNRISIGGTATNPIVNIHTSYVGQTSITTLGTIGGSAVWNATQLIANKVPDHDDLNGFVASEHIDHTSVSITGTGALGGGGTISSNRTINMNTPGTLSGSTNNSSTTNHTHSISTGISSGDIVEFSSAVTDNDYAKVTATGLEGRTYAEVKVDLSLNNVENTALSTWAGTAGADGSVIRRKNFATAASTTTTCTHNLGNRLVNVQVFRSTTPWDQVEAEVVQTSATVCTVNFNVATTLGEYDIIITG